MDLEQPARRRRGAELENALLDAAWEQLTQGGYAAFTIDAVAERAGTSKPVVYRRWADKHELLRAAVRHVSDRTIRPAPDTGSLRGDLIEQLVYASRHRLNLAAMLMVHLGGYFEESGTSPADLRELLLGGSRSRTEEAVERAVARGEVDPDRLTPRIIDLPFALFRHEAMMTLKPVPEEVAAEIVDTIFLPLVRPLP
ncbi:TetR/AcrR family transcriptional regulator [Aeromicrobium endophyticum]|uniref:TetR/AcrR family transcriptional regulator n=1 Tax=Aeromicrobium endophyticum TaxID=2292704 RepID=A0A371P9J8_9ACTN|nr:TetR/AcrR family transcriptional regulator [Aeromicrobium endophyticum]REK72601.1 TetR/AcrR family transcriptional regulator [Aeromicrobium endophyticum]